MSIYYKEREPSEFFAALLRVSSTFMPMESESGQVGMVVGYTGEFESSAVEALPGVDPNSITQHCAVETISRKDIPFELVKGEEGVTIAVAGVYKADG